MSTVTIGDQKFIKDREKGWIDAKTKQPADKGLIKLLDSLVVEEPEVKKLRVKIDRRVEPVTIAGQKFVYDVNQGWLDDKTKVRAPESLQRTLSNAVPRFGENDTADIDLTAGFGMAGEAGLKKTKEKKPPTQKTGGGTIVKNRNTAINKPLIAMINQLASIDGYLKQQLQNQKILDSNELARAREAAIEAKPEEADIEGLQPDAKPETSKLAALGGAVGLSALIALQFDPVKQAISSVADFGGKIISSINDVAKSLNSAFDWLLGGSGSGGGTTPQANTNQTPTTPPATNVAPVSNKTWEEALTKQSQSKEPSYVKPVAEPTQQKPSGNASTKPPMAVKAPTAPAAKATPAAKAPVTNDTWSQALSKPQPMIAKPVSSTAAPSKPAVGKQADAQANPAAIPKGDIVALGRYLQGQGLRITGHSAFGGQEPGQHSANSRHYKDMAIDVNVGTGLEEANDPAAGARFDALQQQLESAGYNVIWRKAGHYNHMHVSVGGPEGIGGGESPIAGAVDTITNTVDIAKKLFKKGGAALIGAKRYEPRDINPEIKPRSERLGQLAKSAAIEKTTVMADSRTPAPVPTMQKPSSMPNINPDKNSPVIQSPATENDMSGVSYYLERFGFKPAESEMSR